ncbi:MAG: DUF4956 domain-containing protein [Clostridia bacterium]|nr:DUF4956 domain-containing protein [Clostridia bacterium]
MFSSILGDELNISSVMLCFLVSIVLGLIVAIVHKKTSKCSKNFFMTLVLLPVLVQVVILMVNGNLGTSVAVLGAFSLIRFRSIPGNSKEIVTIFLSMAIGLATGMGQLIFAAVVAIISVVLIIIMYNLKFGASNELEKMLKITVPEDLDYTGAFDEIFEKYTSSYVVEQVKTTNMGSMFEIKYKINMKNGVNEKEFIDNLRVRNGNLNITITNPIVDSNEL